MSLVTSIQVRLRKHRFETAECEYCRYFVKGYCKVLDIDVDAEQVCDAYQGAQDKFKPYTVAKKDIMSFIKGMRRLQPYKHFVMKGIETPIGPLIIIKDSMKPIPHYFSLDMKFSLEHTSREHFWTQNEVDRIIRVGRKTIVQ